MAKKPKAPTEASQVVPLVIEGTHAPFVYFDETPNYGHGNGVINFTLAAYLNTATSDGGVAQNLVAVGHLRCSVPAAIALRTALDKALLGNAPAQGQIN